MLDDGLQLEAIRDEAGGDFARRWNPPDFFSPSDGGDLVDDRRHACHCRTTHRTTSPKTLTMPRDVSPTACANIRMGDGPAGRPSETVMEVRPRPNFPPARAKRIP